MLNKKGGIAISIKEQEAILKRLDPNFKKLNAAETSDLINKKASRDEMKVLKSVYPESMRLANDAGLSNNSMKK